MKTLYKLFAVLAILILPIHSQASSAKGTYISSRLLSPNTYEIRVNQYIDCSTPIRRSFVFVDFSNDCGTSFRQTIALKKDPYFELGDTLIPNARGGVEVSQLCPSEIQNSQCNGGNLPGVERVAYIDTLTLSPACNKWYVFHNMGCCRITTRNLNTTNNAGVLSELNTIGAANNRSPIFTSRPSPILISGSMTNYDPGVVDPDGDSLVFSLVDAIQGFNSTTNSVINDSYRTPYSGASPIAGMQINSNTGLMTLTPNISGLWVVVLKVEEYDRLGNFRASTIRDMLFSVGTIGNRVPNLSSALSYTGDGTQVGITHIEICPRDGFDISFSVSDPDSTDTLSFNTNVLSSFPGTQITTQSFGDSMAVRLQWNGQGQAGETRFFSLEFSDGVCPIPGEFSFAIQVDIVGYDASFELPELVCRQAGEYTRIDALNYQEGGFWSIQSDTSGVFLEVSHDIQEKIQITVEHDRTGRCGATYLSTITLLTHITDYEIYAAGQAFPNTSDNLHHFAHELDFSQDNDFQVMPTLSFYDQVLFRNLDTVPWFSQVQMGNPALRFRYNPDSIAQQYGFGAYRIEIEYNEMEGQMSCSSYDTAFVFICDDSLNLNVTESYVSGPNSTLDTILTANPSGLTYRWMINGYNSNLALLDTVLNSINISEIRRQQGFAIREVSPYGYEDILGGITKDTNRTCLFGAAEDWNSSVGINELANSQEIKVYPNPTKEQIWIRANTKIQYLELFDILGNSLLLELVNSNEAQLKLDALPAGLYMLNVQTEFRTEIKKIKKL